MLVIEELWQLVDRRGLADLRSFIFPSGYPKRLTFPLTKAWPFS
jgi:hypothetical protein